MAIHQCDAEYARGRCQFVGKHEYRGRFLCGLHFVYAKRADRPPPPPRSNASNAGGRAKKAAPPPPPPPPVLTDEEKEIMRRIRKYLLNYDPAGRKKEGRALLRMIHPDKCKFVNLDAHVLSQQVIKHMQA